MKIEIREHYTEHDLEFDYGVCYIEVIVNDEAIFEFREGYACERSIECHESFVEALGFCNPDVEIITTKLNDCEY